jgi:hypothetical protein
VSARSAAALRRATRAACLVAIAAAASACNNKRVARIEPTSVTDLSGRWNDADSRLVANELIDQSLSAQWARRYADTHGGQAPTIIVGGFDNRTMEHIPVGTFLKDLERAYVNSGAVRVVAAADERQDIRAEREDQQLHAVADSRARLAREQGASYMLQGEVQSIEDAEGREKVVYYQVDAALVDLESNAKVWVGQHKIKKYIDRRRIGW